MVFKLRTYGYIYGIYLTNRRSAVFCYQITVLLLFESKSLSSCWQEAPLLLSASHYQRVLKIIPKRSTLQMTAERNS